MPPAFNLSQDQTLQFETCLQDSLLNRPTQPFHCWNRQAEPRTSQGLAPLTSPHLRTSSVSTTVLVNPQQAPAKARTRQASSTPAPTPIGCKLLKIRPDRRSSRVN